MIKGTTKMMCLLGNPVSHSLSPGLHNELCKLNEFDGCYTAFSPTSDDLGSAIKGLKALGSIGFNVTFPYKEAVIPFIDEIDEDAKLLNAVNTVVIKENKTIGYNTDVYGVEQLLKVNGVQVENQVACILGTGGASRAVAVALIKQGVKRIDFYSRKIRDNAFIKSIGDKCEVNNFEYSMFEENKVLYKAIINGTPLGMKAYKNERAVDPVNLNPSTVVIDLIYSPKETNLLTFASEQGYNIVNGYDMLYYQGLKAFSLWTGIYVDYYSEIKKILL